jgi:NADPH:quinone reductase-like Zn-dependent oxidoreductase
MVKAFGYRSNGGPDVQEFLDLEMPAPLPGELLVEVRSAGVNPVDWKIRSGMLGETSAADLPAVLGSEVSGIVREVGKDVEGFAENEEVFGSVAPGSGGYAEFTLVTATAAARKPPQVSFNDAATLPPLMTVWRS